MLLEENGISGPPVPKSEAVDASPFDFSGAMSSGGTMPPSSDKKRSRGGKAGSKASKAKAKTQEGGATALGADELHTACESAPPPPPFISSEVPSRRESEGEEKRLSAGSILALFDQVDGQAAAAVVAANRDSLGGKVQTPAPTLEHIDTSLCEAGFVNGEAGFVNGDSGKGTSPSLNQLSPINPMHLNDLLTAF